jgi:hypothetical protein
MPDTPDVIAKAINSAGDAFNPAAPHPLYESYRSLWQLYTDLLELDSVKLRTLIDAFAEEDAAKLTLRKQLAACFNLVPTVINMIRDYLFAEEPSIDVGSDATLKDFLSNADGNGTKYADLIKNRILPLALAHGMVDVLVENPAVDGDFLSASDAQEAGVAPVATPFTALQRINWSANPRGSYNWVCYIDTPLDDPNPFARNRAPITSYLTYSAISEAVAGDSGFWLRSWKGSRLPQTPESAADQPAGDISTWTHVGDFVPTARVPVATLYYQRSLDHEKPHWGISKIAMIAVLTRLMIQVLSWTEEDILSSLALLAMPGAPPNNEDGTPRKLTLTAASVLYFPKDATKSPEYIQGDVAHIKAKMDFVAAIVQEILRLAHLIGASAEAEQVTSGVQGMVMRNELFQELSTLAGALDSFTYEILALVKSWATNSDWDVKKLLDEVKPVVSFKKEGFTLEPLSNLIDDAGKILTMFHRISPEMCKAVYKLVARETLYSEDSALAEVLKEVDDNTEGELAADAAVEDTAGQTADLLKQGAALPASEVVAQTA